MVHEVCGLNRVNNGDLGVFVSHQVTITYQIICIQRDRPMRPAIYWWGCGGLEIDTQKSSICQKINKKQGFWVKFIIQMGGTSRVYPADNTPILEQLRICVVGSGTQASRRQMEHSERTHGESHRHTNTIIHTTLDVQATGKMGTTLGSTHPAFGLAVGIPILTPMLRSVSVGCILFSHSWWA